MKVMKLTALALATSLVLTGCGDNDDTDANDGSSQSGQTETNLSEQEQAKEIIRTAKLFVSDNKAIKEAYEGASEILTNKQQKRFTYAFDVPSKIQKYMQENSLTRLDATELNRLIKSKDFQNDSSRLKITPGKDFVATLDSNGKFTLSGGVTVDTIEIDYLYNRQTFKEEKNVTTDNFMTSYQGFENATQNNTSTTTPQLSFGFDGLTIGSGSEKMMLTSSKQGLKAQGTFSDKVTMNREFDWEETHKKGITLQKAEVNLDNVKLVANDSTVIAKDFVVAMMDVSRTLADGSKEIRSLPYKIDITGHLIKGAPKTDVEMSFNAIANADDVKKYVELSSNDNFVEKDGKYVGMTAMLSLKGKVTKNTASDKAVVIPLDFLVRLKRTARDEVVLEDLTKFSIENKPLHIKGNYNLDTSHNTTPTQLIVTQNNARIELNVDADGKFKTDDHGKLSDIMVNGKDFGDLINSKDKITAKFNDNTFLYL
ncbi:hypothetical protein [Psychrobacter sp. I-STPA10]|uniref:hypothetical protein n=1 Tax=Psychrobacter sp. I-STPA10 TaxID=2585769 RepID=UPI001E2BBF15|nr:hypothetical protein [Psychrobacter sp. I-STPA10]